MKPLAAFVIVSLQDEATRRWHEGVSVDSNGETETILLAHHRANYDLWHEEDKARDPDASDAVIAQVKRNIDRLNQQRVDRIEELDDALITAIAQVESAPLNSETPGQIADRLSILSLRLYHTAEEAHRESADESHRRRNAERLEVLDRQRSDLAGCLDALWYDLAAGRRRFQIYRQMKMYNDPTLNPVLYNRRRIPGAS